jgi:hypothetical protein
VPAIFLDRNADVEGLRAHQNYYGGLVGYAHHESAFHYILDIERRRAARMAQLVLLVLVRRASPGRLTKIDAAAATAVFSALGNSVREADLIGWYRQDLVAGAALIQPPVASQGVRQLVASRVREALRGRPLAGMGFRVFAVSLRGTDLGPKQ